MLPQMPAVDSSGSASCHDYQSPNQPSQHLLSNSTPTTRKSWGPDALGRDSKHGQTDNMSAVFIYTQHAPLDWRAQCEMNVLAAQSIGCNVPSSYVCLFLRGLSTL